MQPAFSIRPLFATPCYGGNVTTVFLRSWTRLALHMFRENMTFDIMTEEGESLITRARNKMVARFLQWTDFTHLFWIDADIGFEPEAVFRLLRADHDVVAGIYPLKREQWPVGGVPAGTTRAGLDIIAARHPVNTGSEAESAVLKIDADGFMELGQAPTGFLCIRREVLERMMAACPELKLSMDGPPGNPLDPTYFAFFDTMIHPARRTFLSEDYAFCERWRAIGGKVHVDTRSDLVHPGFRAYRGNFAASLRHDLAATMGGPAGQKMRIA